RPTTARDARRFLLEHGDEPAFELVAVRLADLRAKDRDTSGVDETRVLLLQELSSPHRLRDLAIDGSDLIAAGLEEGPDLGRALQELLELVVDDPSVNTRERLLEFVHERGWAPST